MKRTEIRTQVVETLAQMKRRDATELERELKQAGPECPFDSIYLARVAVKVARQLGFKIKPSAKIAPSFKSVEALTTLLEALATKRPAA
jgi:acyl carrier protein